MSRFWVDVDNEFRGCIGSQHDQLHLMIWRAEPGLLFIFFLFFILFPWVLPFCTGVCHATTPI
ncbi:hypothetical protein BDV59DRAFT_32794 [Aspergillus ambiguus]|uniref:uncharacterized protein n=1 Tax=Aspergillus ambiguus TaxID=176160 RepID=UPI003CCD23D0